MVKLLHEKIKLDLFHGEYEVVVGGKMSDMIEHLETTYRGVKFPEDAVHATGYTALINSVNGVGLFVLIQTDKNFLKVSNTRTIHHEAVHLSWYILDALGITIDRKNHEMQAYLVEDIIEKITTLVEKYLSK